MIRVLITGAGGQLGRAFARGWPVGNVVLALDASALDVGDAARVSDVLDTFKPDLVINCAAFTHVDRAQAEPERAGLINGRAPALLARELVARGAALIHFSTDYVFDGSLDRPYVESDDTQPLSVYGASKREGELAVDEAGGASLVFRTSWLYSHQGENFFMAIVRQLYSRDELQVVDDQTGAPTYAEDMADAIRGYVLDGLGINTRSDSGRDRLVARIAAARGLYHLGAQGFVSRADFARNILERVRANDTLRSGVRCLDIIPTATAATATTARRPLNSRLNSDKSRTVLGIELPSWQSGLDRCVAAFERQSGFCGAAA